MWITASLPDKDHQLTGLADVVSLRVAVGGVADRCVVGVRGQLVIQFLRAVDKNGQMLDLVTLNKKKERKKKTRLEV